MPLIISGPTPTSKTVKEIKQNRVYFKKTVTLSKIASARHFSMKTKLLLFGDTSQQKQEFN
jgi:hypothetical protein